MGEEPKQRSLAFYDRGPGPAGWMLPPLVGRRGLFGPHGPTHRINPEWSIAERLKPYVPFVTPGPAAYGIDYGLKTNGKFIGYLYTMRQKFGTKNKLGLPLYNLPDTNVYKPRAPRALISLRTPLYNKKISPGPIYMLPPAIGPKIPDKLAAPELTFKGDRKFKPPYMSPGPIYVVKTDLIKPRAPAFSIRLKLSKKRDDYDAGPASYTPKAPPPCICSTPKGAPFGVRYNDFTGIFRTPCDYIRIIELDC